MFIGKEEIIVKVSLIIFNFIEIYSCKIFQIIDQCVFIFVEDIIIYIYMYIRYKNVLIDILFIFEIDDENEVLYNFLILMLNI